MPGAVRFGVVGAGVIAQSHVAALRSLPGAEIVGVADSRPEAARALAEECGCAAHSDHVALAQATNVDAVIVCTPPAFHPALTIELLERDIAVLCEKPLAIDSEAAQAMCEASRRSGALFTMASKFRYVEDVVRARSLVASGIVGDVVLFENAFTGRVDMSQRWNSQQRISGGGVLIDNGTHAVDLLRYFLGPIEEVQAVEGKRLQHLEVEDTAQLFVRSRDGVMGTIDLSWSVDKRLDDFLRIHGSEGTLRVGWQGSYYARHGSPWVRFGEGYDKLGAFTSQLENFVAALRGEEDLRVTPEDGLASVRVIEAAYRSLDSSRYVPVEPVLRAAAEPRGG
ncbi:MAG: Gfo/Idh/MocA family protein [Myxococcota bacterium]